MLEQPPSTFMKDLVMIGFIVNLHTELSLRTYLLSCLQRTKLPSRKPTQDYNLFKIGCQTSLYQLVNDCNISLCSYICFMISKCGEKYQNYGILMIFVIFDAFNRNVLCHDIYKMS